MRKGRRQSVVKGVAESVACPVAREILACRRSAVGSCWRNGAIAVLLAALAALIPVADSNAQQVLFDKSWKEQGFPRLKKNTYRLNGDSVEILSDDAISILFRRLPESFWNGRKASWQWTVRQGVAPTNLKARGGEDRNVSIYFLFLPREIAERLRNRSMARIFDNKHRRMIQYMHGGAHDPGERFYSPYGGKSGLNVVLRTSLGTHREEVDLESDYVAAFGFQPEVLIGIGLSADSDDTDGMVRATVSEFHIH